MTGFFVTGTDTGVGKTVVSAALLAATVARGGRAYAFKPAESGCVTGPAGLLPADAEFLYRAAGAHQDLAEVCPYRFAAAIAPGAAADRENRAIDFDRIAATVGAALARRPDLVLVEGAGGLLVPYGQGRVAADLAACLGLPLLLVARAGLGTINHTLLTLEAARTRSLEVAAVVLNDPAEATDPAFARENAAAIATAGTPVLGPFPRLPDPTSLLAYAEAGEELIEQLLGDLLPDDPPQARARAAQILGDDLEG